MTYVQNPLVSWLLNHAYGQGGTVAVPTENPAGQPPPLGEFPPGIGEMLDHLVGRFSAAATTEIDWCFLVGGPGNGKSEALRTLASRLGVTLPPRVPGQRVPRVIPQAWPTATTTLPTGLSIAFVNDASIPRPLQPGNTPSPGSLFLDIIDALTLIATGKGTALFVNVNRGILVEELAGLQHVDQATATPGQRLAGAMIRWLSTAPRDAGSTDDGVDTLIRPQATTPHYGQFRVSLSTLGLNLVVVVHVVFLDVLSLLEPRPGRGSVAIDFSTSPPIVAPYQTLGRLVSKDVTRGGTITGGLVRLLVDAGKWQDGGCKSAATGETCQAYAHCPFAQNVAWLQNDLLRERFLDTLRAAEVAAGRRLTYRDLLGHSSLAIVGPPREEWLAGRHPCSWVEQQHQAATGVDKSKRAVVELASTRIHLNLFPGAGFATSKAVAKHKLAGDSLFNSVLPLVFPAGEPARPLPLERAFSDIDPARDTGRWDGLRKKVLDAVESLDVEDPTIQVSAWPGIQGVIISEVERMLDRVVREEIASELPRGSRAATARVRVLRRWRAAMLLRLVGLATGHVRFATALEAWLAEQENALNSGTTRLKLGDGINNLILPSGGAGKVYLAPFRPRTYCLSGELPKNTFLVSVNVNELDVVIVAHGDTLVAEVQVRRKQEAPKSLAVLTIDLAVAREAILHSDRKTESFTEIGDTAFARIERAHTSLLGRERLLGLPACYTDERSTVFHVSPNPTGQPPLRVQQS